jgi:hypothetical protein
MLKGVEKNCSVFSTASGFSASGGPALPPDIAVPPIDAMVLSYKVPPLPLIRADESVLIELMPVN